MSVVNVQVTNFPAQISQDEFGKLFSRLEGFLGCRIVRAGNSEPVGYIDFTNAAAAENAVSIYHGWRGWSSSGLIMKTMQPLPTAGQPLKRSREGPDVYGDPRLKQPRPSNLGYALSNGGFGSPAPQQSLAYSRLSNVDPVGPIPGIASPGVLPMQQQTPAQQRPPQQLAQGNVSSLAFGMDTVQQSATAQRPARPAAAQSYTNPNFIPVAGSIVTPQQPTPQQQQQQQEQVRAVRAAIIQQQGSNLGLPQGYGSPGYQGQAMNGQRPGPQGLVPGAFANLLPVPSSAPPSYAAPDNQYQMGQPNSGLPPAGMQPGSHLGASLGQGQAQQLHQQLPTQQQQLPHSGQLPGQQLYQPSGQLPPAQERPMYQDSYSAATLDRQEPVFHSSSEPQTHRIVEIVQPEAEEEEVLPPEANPTLFLSGLPLDITKREVAHILRPCEGFKELRLVQKVDRNNKDVMWCFAEFSSKQLAARAMNDLQGYAVDLDDQDSPTLRISYARALNNPKVREGRAAAEEPRSSTPLEVRVDRPQPYRDPRSPLDPRGSRDMLRGPAEPYGQVQHHREPDLIPVDPRRDVRGRPQPRDATPNRRDAYGADYGRGPPPGQRGGPDSRGGKPPGYSSGPPRNRDDYHGPPGGGGSRRPRGPPSRR